MGWGISLVLDVAPAGVPGGAQWSRGPFNFILQQLQRSCLYPAEPAANVRGRPKLSRYACPGACGRVGTCNKTRQKGFRFVPIDVYLDDVDEVARVYVCSRCVYRLRTAEECKLKL